MPNFNELKEKVMTTIGTVADITKDFAAQTGDKAKGVARMAKLSVEITTEKETIKKAYSEIGKLYYETHKDNPEGFFTQLCEEVSLANSSIADKEAEIAAIKSELNEQDDDGTIEVEFEEVVAEDECGKDEADSVPEQAEEETAECDCEECGEHAATPTEKVVHAVTDAAREVADAVKEAYKDITEKRDTKD